MSLLGRASESEFYEDMYEYKNLVQPPRVQVFRFQAPLYYANKDVFLRSVYKTVGVEPFLEISRRRKEEKKAKLLSLRQSKENGEKNNGEVVIGLVERELDFDTLVLDCSAIPFLDSTGVSTFKGLVKEYKDIGVDVVLASCNASVIDTLQKSHFFGKGNKDMSCTLFHTVHAAVLYANSHSTYTEVTSEDQGE